MTETFLRKSGLILYFILAALSMALYTATTIQNSYIVLASFAILFLTGATLLFKFNYGLLAYVIPLSGYVIYTIPTITSGVFHGFDSWKYIRSARMISEKGWYAEGSPFPHTHQFPGVQFSTVFIAEIVGVDIVTVARFLTPIITASVILIVVVLSRQLGASHSHGALAALLAASYYNLTAFSTYHHALFGFVFTFLVISILHWYIETKRYMWGITFIIVFAALVVSHQYSTFVVTLILAGITIIGLYIQDDLTRSNLSQRGGIIGLLLVPSVLAATYYVYIGQEFLEIFAVLAVLGSFPTTAPPDPFLVERLVLLKNPPVWETFVFSRHIQMVVVLGLALLVIGYLWYTDNVPRHELDLPVMLLAVVAVFGVMAVLGQVVDFISGIARNLRYAVPLIITLFLGLASRSMDQHKSVRPLLIVVVVVFIVLSVSMYPGYLVGSGTSEYENSYSIEMTHDHQALLDFIATHRASQPVIYGDTQSRFYFYLHDGTTATESPYPYAGRINEEAYMISRARHEQILFLRGDVHQYRVPSAMRDRYDGHWTKPYSSGDSELYQVSEDDSIHFDHIEQ